MIFQVRLYGFQVHLFYPDMMKQQNSDYPGVYHLSPVESVDEDTDIK